MMPPPAESALGLLMATLPRSGRVEWIGLRSRRELPMLEVEQEFARFLQDIA